jgi:hypothetical protein
MPAGRREVLREGAAHNAETDNADSTLLCRSHAGVSSESERVAEKPAMTLRRVPSKRLPRRAPIAYVPRHKETPG